MQAEKTTSAWDGALAKTIERPAERIRRREISNGKAKAMLKRLGLGTLSELDHGRLAAEFDEDLNALARDCRDRPLLDKVRRLTLMIEIKPVRPPSGAGAIGTSVVASVDTSFPKRQTAAYTMELTADAGLNFRGDSPDDPNQSTFADANSADGAVDGGASGKVGESS